MYRSWQSFSVEILQFSSSKAPKTSCKLTVHRPVHLVLGGDRCRRSASYRKSAMGIETERTDMIDEEVGSLIQVFLL